MKAWATGCVFLMLASATLSSAAARSCEALTIAAFGTSLTTRGEWPEALAQELERRIGRSVAVVNLARSGATSDWGVKAAGEVAALRPDIVLIEFAINDSGLWHLITPGASQRNLRAIVERIRSDVPDAGIYLMTMSPALGWRGWVRPLLDRYYGFYQPLALSLGVRSIDLRPAWASLTPSALHDALPDGLHPDSRVATGLIVPVIAEALEKDMVGQCP